MSEGNFTAGDLFVATDDKTVGRIPAGDAGDVLTSAGPGAPPTYETPAPPGDTIPPGALMAYGGSAAPAGWLLCDGSAVSRATYADLFAVVGEAYGAGNGTTTFNVPNLKGRLPIGLDGADTDFDALGETRGAKTVAAAGSNSAPTFTGDPLAAHDHGIGTFAAANESAHTHGVTSNVSVGNHTFTQPTIAWPSAVPTAANESSHTHSVTSNVSLSDHSGHSHTFTQSTNEGTPDLLAPDLTATGVAAGGTTSTEILSHAGLVTNTPVTSGTGSSHTHSIVWPGDVPTATGGAVSAHSVTNNAVTSDAGSAHTHALSGTSGATSGGTPSGAVSAPAFTGSPTSVVQPVLVVNYIIKT